LNGSAADSGEEMPAAAAGTPERELLDRGLAQLRLTLPGGAAGRLLAHVDLVRQWSRGYNLVAPGDLDSLVARHVLDSLAIMPFVAGGALLDVGSGAGFPGVPLAVADPGLQVTVLDSSGKKARFLRHVQRALGLPNLVVEHARVQDHETAAPCACIVSRAFSSLLDFVTAVRHLAAPESRLLAMKGRRPDRERAALPGWVRVQSVERIEVPYLHAERHLVIMCVSPETAPEKATIHG
jgi:16S rRNA (guanine527-N7)-methyltransferase